MTSATDEQPRLSLAVIDHGVRSGAELVARVQRTREVMRDLMEENVHYGRVPGTQKPSLWKPGAELLLMTFHIGPQVHVTDLSTEDERRYRVKVTGIAQTSGESLGEGIGEASTDEDKYRWRAAVHDKEWTATPVDHRRIKYQRDGKEVRQVRTWPADLGHTVLLMAVKRAMLNMTRVVTACSDIFDQDLEDLPDDLRPARPDFKTAATAIADQYDVTLTPRSTPLPPEAGAGDGPEDARDQMEVHHFSAARLGRLPAGVVLIERVASAPTKNPTITRYTLTVAGGPSWPMAQRRVTTINERLASRAEAAWHSERAVAVTTTKGKFGYELASIEEALEAPAPTDAADTPPGGDDPAIPF